MMELICNITQKEASRLADALEYQIKDLNVIKIIGYDTIKDKVLLSNLKDFCSIKLRKE